MFGVYIYSNTDDYEIQARRQEKRRKKKNKTQTQNFNQKTKLYFGLLLQRSGFVLINFKRKHQKLMMAAISREYYPLLL